MNSYTIDELKEVITDYLEMKEKFLPLDVVGQITVNLYNFLRYLESSKEGTE
jgi:hypothetical protein